MIDPIVLLLVLMVPIAAFIIAGATIATLSQTNKIKRNIHTIRPLTQTAKQAFVFHNASR
ncbi:hypothetical protein [Alteromonas flava]|uniref:hypothetical protein n=1 Tax=Alteromonas flava TaxID=2048003 RepID=UPI000C289EDB|nr:hypothetical protein [Alteromonas flava]